MTTFLPTPNSGEPFYPFRHDVIDPVVSCDAYAAYMSLTHGGTHR